MSFPDSEPAITAGSLTALVTAGLALVAAFGVPLTTEQREAILAVVAVVAPFVVAWLIRPHVTPNAKVVASIDENHSMVTAPAPAAPAAPPELPYADAPHHDGA